ncbi:POC1 centriolar protein A, partial [Ceratobasidium sp. 428]
MRVGQARKVYSEALKKVEQMQKQPGLPEISNEVGSAFRPLLDLGSLMIRIDPTGGAEVAFSVCAKAWEHLERQGNRDAELSELVKRLARMIPSVELVKDIADTHLKETLADMLNLIEDVCLFILSAGPRRTFERAFQAAAGPDVLGQSQAYITRFEELSKEFNLRMGAQVLRGVEVESKHVEVERMNAKLRELKPADLAGHDPTRKCLAGTRTSIIDELVNWAYNSDGGPRLAWVHGLAGLGKSSIATSVCLRFDDQHALASSFFCKRDSPELRDPRRVLTTIIYGLALRWEAYRDVIVSVIVEDPELHSKHIQPLYDSLVTKPLQNLVKSERPTNRLVVVIDALDECGDISTRKQLLACLWGMSQLEPWLRIIVTSRPDPDIREFFGHAEADRYTEYNLLDYDAEADVRILIENYMNEGTQADDWPKDVVEQLSSRANGLFIWAETACRFILDGFDQAKRLNQILTGAHTGSLSAQLDILYTTAVKNGALDGGDDNMEYVMKCLGVVIATATRTPLSVASLAQLLGERIITYKVLNRVLGSLSSVLYEDQKQGNVVRVLHPSFMDYITDSSRSKQLCIDLEQQNSILAKCCIEVMNEGLKFNMCNLETSHLLNSQVPNLDSQVQDAIRPHLSYSCLYWSSHVSSAHIGALDDCLRSFLFQTPLMYWIEALSLLGKLRTALSSLLQFTGCSILDYMQDCVVVASDAYRFVMSFYDAISKSTPHLYISALAFAPSNSGIAQRMRSVFSKLLTVIQGTETEWTPCLSSIWVGSVVQCVAVSPNGQRIVSGSMGSTVRVWDAETGDVVLGPLSGHSGYVTCVAFSPDGRWIVSGSRDKTIRIWNAETGEPRLDPLRGHTDEITSVAFSPNGHRLVSGSRDDTMCVWEIKAGQSAFKARDLLDWVESVAFSPDGHWIASAGYTLCIWDAQTGKLAFKPVCVYSGWATSVAFSPDSHRIVLGHTDSTIRIRDTKTGDILLGPLRGHSDRVRSVAFSADGRRIASASDDKTVRIWDAHTGNPVTQPLDSHSRRVTSVAFCPNRRVVSGSDDKTVRIWDVVDRGEVELAKRSNASNGHSGYVNSVAFLSDGYSVISGSLDSTVRIWDAETGEPVQEPLKGQADAAEAVAVSSNGRWIASGSRDQTVRIWDAATGKVTLELQGHSNSVSSVAFSPDCRLVVSGSDDRTVRIWDVETGEVVLEPLSHPGEVMSVAFSPDGHRIASGSRDGSVRIWDSSMGQVMVRTPQTKPSCVWSVAFAPDSHRIVFSSHDGTNGTISVLDVETGDTLFGPIEAHNMSVLSVAFSPDGRWIASAGSDAAIRIWNAQTGQSVLEPLQGHTSIVTSVAFSPDGRRIVSGSMDLSVRIWDVDPRTLSYAANPKHLP